MKSGAITIRILIARLCAIARAIGSVDAPIHIEINGRRLPLTQIIVLFDDDGALVLGVREGE